MFTNASPNQIVVPNSDTSEVLLENLSAVPYVLIDALKNSEIKQKIMNDFSNIGYPISKISVIKTNISKVGLGVPLIELQEVDLKCPTSQLNMSQGMYRALSLIVIIEHILSINKPSTVVIDDLGEGLDYSRATKIMNLLFKKVHNSKIQLIVTSNDRFLINATDVKYLNLLERTAHITKAFNYANSKKQFDDFIFTGLSNFDFLSTNFYSKGFDE